MSDVALRPLHAIELCAGVAMLGEGVRAALRLLGRGYRTVCYVEREAPAAAQLVALMEAECLDAAPVWSDLLTFDGSPWRGRVDCIVAGFPCQPHSVAGKREGLEDDRWIWPDIVRIVREVRPSLVVFENVPGLATTGGLAACIADLASLGFDAEWGLLRAAAVGASHERERLFIVAYARFRVAPGLEHEPRSGGQPAEHQSGEPAMADANHDGRQGCRVPTPEGRIGMSDPGGAGAELGDANGTPGAGRLCAPGRPKSRVTGVCMADTIGARPQERAGGG